VNIPQPELEEIHIPVERTLAASSQSDMKAVFEVLKANIGRTVDLWALSTAKSSYVRGADLNVPEHVRTDRMRAFVGALIMRAENPNDRRSHEVLKSAIRAEHGGQFNFSAIVRRQSLLRDSMLQVVEHELPSLSKTTAKLALDSMIDKSVEATLLLMDQYSEMRNSISLCMPGAPDSKYSFDQALARFCKSVLDYFDADFIAVFKYSQESKELICLASSAKSITLAKDSTFQVDAVPLAAEAISSMKTTSSSEEPSGHKKKQSVKLSFKNTVVSPIIHDSKVEGLFIVGDSSRIVPLTPVEVDVVEDLAVQVAWVLESSRMFQQMHMRSRAQKLLIETAAAVQQEIESEEIFRIVASRVAELVPCDELALYVFDWQKRTCSPVFATGHYSAEIMADKDFPADTGIVGYIGRTRKPEIILDSEADPRAEYIPGTPQTHTRMLAVPIVGKKETIGVIELMRYPPNNFFQEDLEIAVMFANHAAVALENAKLLKEITSERDQVEMHMDLLTHDIANYATPITAYFESIRAKKNLDPDVATMTEKTGRQVENMMRLIEMVRVLSRIREGPARSFRNVDLRAAIDGAIVEVRDRAHVRGLEFDVTLPREQVMLVKADELLDEVFINLFYSAGLTETQQKNVLSITAEVRRDRKVDYWWVKVAQPSRAIPHHLKAAVLKLSKSSKTELAGGFGIGFAAARSIVDRFGGSMWVSDIVPGDYTKGCVFNIMLPRVQ
jgi:GAF domain-containing protein